MYLFNFGSSLAQSSPSCEDLLEKYAQKPPLLDFVRCEEDRASPQLVIRMVYQVPGKDAQKVEDFLVKHYGMRALRWACCGWESGQTGSLQSSPLQDKYDGAAISITMYGSGEKEDAEGKAYLVFDKEQVDYFTVVVEVIDA